MKKLKFLLLTFLFISCLNSCFFLASFCADYGCMKTGEPKFSKKDPRGIYLVLYEKGYENYPEEILQRKKEYVEIENHKILLPENTTLKKFRDALSGSGYNYRMGGEYEHLVHYYLYDKERKVGFPLGFRFDKEDGDFLGWAIDGKDESIVKEDKHIYYKKVFFSNLNDTYYSDKMYINRISEDIYIIFGDYSDEDRAKSRRKVTNFLKELVKEWEK